MMWNLPPPPGFQGLHPEIPVTVYVRHLPHWRQAGATYSVTFRQHDSLPQEKLRELENLRNQWEQQHPSPRTRELWERFAHETMRRTEAWLDQGMGSCRLKDPSLAQVVVDAMHNFDSQRYDFGCYVIMPNHVHVIVRQLVETIPLERVLQSWKRHTALEINRRCGLTGPFWQEESYDRIIRDEEHLFRAIQYVGSNSSKAGLSCEQCPRWIRPEWEELGWKFE